VQEKYTNLEPEKFEYDSDLADRLKLDEDERIVCQYSTRHRSDNMGIIALFISFISCFILLFFGEQGILFRTFVSISAMIIFYFPLKRYIINYKMKSFYVTNKNIILENGDKYPLNEILFRGGGGEWAHFHLYCYEQDKITEPYKLRISVIWPDNDKKFDNLILSLYHVSHNDLVLYYGSPSISIYTKHKPRLIGENKLILDDTENEIKFE